MKKLLFTIILMVVAILPAFADIMPHSSTDLERETMGMYQVPKTFVVYAKPDTKSKIVYRASWDYKNFNASSGDASRIFAVFIQEKELAYVQVADFSNDWLLIIYDNGIDAKTGKKAECKKGWIKSEDLRFMNLRSFYNVYGRKYGLKILTDTPKDLKDLKTSTEEDAQTIAQLRYRKTPLKLNAIKGNWALIRTSEDNVSKIGYIRWRGDNGAIYIFPDIK